MQSEAISWKSAYPALAEDAADNERDIRRPLAEPAHEVRKPFAAERDVDAHPVAVRRRATPADRGGCRTASGTRSDRSAMPCSRATRAPASIIAGSCVAIAGIVPVVEQRLHHPHVRGVDVGLLLIRDRLRLLVRALDQPNARAERVDPRATSCFAAIQRRLQHDADVAVALLPQRLEDRRASPRCTASSPCRCARRSRAGSARSRICAGCRRARAVDVEAELRQLQRDVAARCRTATIASIDARGSRASRHRLRRASARSRRGSRASACRPRASTPRAASIASSTVSPAMNRRAKLGRLCACRSARRVS